jgi:hypothetical protein
VTAPGVPDGKSVIEIASAVVFDAVINPLPDFVASWVEVAVIVAVPATAGVKTPALLTVPMVDGLTDQVTDEL